MQGALMRHLPSRSLQSRDTHNCEPRQTVGIVREGFKEEVAFAMSLEEEGVGVLRSPE